MKFILLLILKVIGQSSFATKQEQASERVNKIDKHQSVIYYNHACISLWHLIIGESMNEGYRQRGQVY